MKRTNMLGRGLFAIVLGIGLSPAVVFAAADEVETGRLLAVLHDSGRVTIGANQPLINDPDKGDKGFTPDNFEKQVTAKFKDRAKVDLGNLKNEKVPELAKKLLPQLIDAMRATVSDYQPVINRPGVGFKGFIPATFGTQAAAKFRAKSGVYLKQTQNPPRNPKNTPDDFELKALAKFAEASYPRQGEKIYSETVDAGKATRIMLPLFMLKGCLPCHGEPKGEKDISGYMREGAKEGDLAGAISVKIVTGK